MKGNIKFIIGIFVGILLCGITGYAANSLLASDITYKDTTVKAALDELYRSGGGTVTSGEAFLITAAKGLKLSHNTDPYTAISSIDNLDFSNIKSINITYSLSTNNAAYQRVKLSSDLNTYFEINDSVNNQTVTLNGPSELLTFNYEVSNYSNGIFTINSYTRMNDTVVTFN